MHDFLYLLSECLLAQWRDRDLPGMIETFRPDWLDG